MLANFGILFLNRFGVIILLVKRVDIDEWDLQQAYFKNGVIFKGI